MEKEMDSSSDLSPGSDNEVSYALQERSQISE